MPSASFAGRTLLTGLEGAIDGGSGRGRVSLHAAGAGWDGVGSLALDIGVGLERGIGPIARELKEQTFPASAAPFPRNRRGRAGLAGAC